MCYSTRASARQTATRRSVEPRPAPWSDPRARIGDADRDEIIALLGDAAAEGYLTPEEFDERLSAALHARTVEDLRNLTGDLPPEWLAERVRRSSAVTAQRRARATVRPRVVTYVRVMALLGALWLIIGITAGAWYPWVIWPALGWGIPLLVQIRAATRPATSSEPTVAPQVKIGT